ncbi:Uncharacterised protein [Chlamydia trachomatis]|nr:Uncharacterised protein [Chlamydia trachomatis]
MHSKRNIFSRIKRSGWQIRYRTRITPVWRKIILILLSHYSDSSAIQILKYCETLQGTLNRNSTFIYQLMRRRKNSPKRWKYLRIQSRTGNRDFSSGFHYVRFETLCYLDHKTPSAFVLSSPDLIFNHLSFSRMESYSMVPFRNVIINIATSYTRN